MIPDGDGSLSVNTRKMREEAARWDEKSARLYKAVQFTNTLDIAEGSYSLAGMLAGMPESYDGVQKMLHDWTLEGAVYFAEIAAYLRRTADDYDAADDGSNTLLQRINT